MSQTHGYRRHFENCNQHHLQRFAFLFIDGKRYGFLDKNLISLLIKETDFFVPHAEGFALSPQAQNFAARSEVLLQATKWIGSHYGKKLRNESYAVIQKWGDDPIAQIDRVAVPWFGIRAWGVHVNGFTRKSDGIHLWIGERAADRLANPGKLDNMIGGGQPIGLTVVENLCKEAKEEAGIESTLALTAKQKSIINYRFESKEGLRSDTIFAFDLELPEDYIPQNTDGEVAAFHLMPISEVAHLVHDTDSFKYNCNLVVIDFLIRHGFILPDHAEYKALQDALSLELAV
jgi:hypothetical protein